MSLRRCIFTMLMVEASASVALGDGLLYQLPPDGTWATYSLDGSSATDTRELRSKAKLRIASVGHLIVDGEPCRWIEVQSFDLDIPGMNSRILESQNQTFKLLIPEKHLSKGSSPIDHVLRGWGVLGPKGQHKPEALRNVNAKEFDWILVPLILAGPLHNPRTLEDAEVDSKLGKVPCGGIRGTLRVESAGNRPATECEVEYRSYAKSPFGIVTADYAIKAEPVTALRLRLRLIDFGKNAVSALPEAK